MAEPESKPLLGHDQDDGAAPDPLSPAPKPTRTSSSQLVADEKKSNKRFWIITIATVASTLIFAIICVIALSVPGDSTPPLSLDDVLTMQQAGRFSWFSGNSELTVSLNGTCLFTRNARTGETLLLANGTSIAESFHLGAPITWVRYAINPTMRYILFATEVEAVYRHSFSAKFLVYDLTAKRLFNLTDTEPGTKQQFATWLPGTAPKALFGRGNNLFQVALTESLAVETPLSEDGSELVLNGVADWVHQEEIIATDTAVFSSPDGARVAWARFDQTGVPITQLPSYAYDQATTGQTILHYPKPGDKIASVGLRVWNGDTVASVPLDDGYVYISKVAWTDATHFVFVELSRDQQRMEYVLVDAAGEVPVKSSLAKMDVGAERWIHPPSSLIYLPAPHNALVDIWPASDGFNGILYLPLAAPTPRVFAMGADVTALVGYRAANQLLIYQIAKPTPMDRSVYAIGLTAVPTGGAPSEPSALVAGSQWASATLSANGDWAILTASTKSTPATVTLYDVSGMAEKSVLEDNAALKKKLGERLMPVTEFFSFTPSYPGAVELNGYRTFPPGVSASSAPVHPVLIYVYGGPGSQTVMNAFGVDWPTYMASTFGVVVVSVDGRGTGARGQEFMSQVKNQLGVLEVEDQMAVVKHVGSWSFVDRTRISMFGWSYGGYMTLRALSSPERHLLRAGIAVAPVSDWRYYDAAYTERYMGTPASNPRGYEVSSVVESARAHNLSTGPSFMLAFGSGDDNVHPQNSMLVLRRQVENDAFNMLTQIFTNDQHSINLPHSKLYVWTLLTRWLVNVLNLSPHHNAPSNVPQSLANF